MKLLRFAAISAALLTLTGCASTFASDGSREARAAVQQVLGDDGSVRIEMRSSPFSGWSCTYDIELTHTLSTEKYREVARAGADAARGTTLDSCSSLSIRTPRTNNDAADLVISPPSTASSLTDDVLLGIGTLVYDKRVDWVGIASDKPETRPEYASYDVPSLRISPRIDLEAISAEALDGAIEHVLDFASELSTRPWVADAGIEVWLMLSPYDHFETQLPVPAETRSLSAALKALGSHFTQGGERLAADVRVAHDGIVVDVSVTTVVADMTPEQRAAIQEFINTVEAFELPVTGSLKTDDHGEQSEHEFAGEPLS